MRLPKGMAVTTTVMTMTIVVEVVVTNVDAIIVLPVDTFFEIAKCGRRLSGTGTSV